MKKLTLTILMLTLSASVAFAHCGVCGVGEAKGSAKGSMKGSDKGSMKADMFAGLELTEEQEEKIRILKETKHNAIDAARGEFKAGLEEILTEDQIELFEGMHKDHHHAEMVAEDDLEEDMDEEFDDLEEEIEEVEEDSEEVEE